MKKGWEIKTLADVCTFENGDRSENYPSKSKRTSKGIPFINAGHFVDNKIDLTNMDYISRERFNLMGRGKIQNGDILFCLRGSLGKFASVGDLPEGQIASSLVIVRPSEQVLHKYLLAYFESSLCEASIERFRGGAAQPNLAAKSLTQFEIPIPPLPEQQRIVSLLDETFAALAQVHANAERNLVNAREVFEAALAKMYENAGEHWEEKNLGDIASEMQTGPFGSTLHKSDYVANGIPVINPQNLVDGKIIPLQKMMVNQKTKERLSRYILQEKDIILARRGEMGRCAIVEKEQAGWLCGSGSFIVRVKKEVDANYLVRYLSSAKVKRILQKGSVGTTMDNLNQGILSQVPVPFPPLEEQRAIVQRLDALAGETQRLEAVYQSKLEAVEELRKSVLQKAFEGGL